MKDLKSGFVSGGAPDDPDDQELVHVSEADARAVGHAVVQECPDRLVVRPRLKAFGAAEGVDELQPRRAGHRRDRFQKTGVLALVALVGDDLCSSRRECTSRMYYEDVLRSSENACTVKW